MKYIDLFGGIGGFRKGIEQAHPDWECVWYNDHDKYATQTYNKNFGTNYAPRDVWDIKAGDIPDHDILCAGFPCQSFSNAGKRRGFKDKRGQLFFKIEEIIKVKKPLLVFLENVRGLLSHEYGETYQIILQKLAGLGYDIQWLVLNSKFHGVPQNRERVFIIAHLRGTSRPEILPLRQDSGQVQEVPEEEGVARPITTRYGRNNTPDNNERGKGTVVFTLERKEFREHKTTGVPTLKHRMGTGGNNVPIIARTLQVAGHGSTNHSNMNVVIDEGKARKLTLTECERLQGFPDGWTEGCSDTQRYKQLGNSVTVNVIEAIARKLK